MLLIYVLVMACASAHRIHFLRAGKNHAPGHFHYKVSVPYAWDATSSIEYFECESSSCTTFESIKKINISNLATTTELQITKDASVYDIECDSSCLQNKVYKYVKVEFLTSTDVSSEIVEVCPGKFVLLDGSCTDTCLFENSKGVCTRAKILCLHGHEKEPKEFHLGASCNAYNRTAPQCSEGVNAGDTCRCFSSCDIEVIMVVGGGNCLGAPSEDSSNDSEDSSNDSEVDASVVFKKKMELIQNALNETYEFFYPKALNNTWFTESVETTVTEELLNCTQRDFEDVSECYEGVNNKTCQCTTCDQIEIYMLRPGEICRNGTGYKTTETRATQSITQLSSYIDLNGPFDSILGFAQGADMAMAYMASVNPFNKAVLLEPNLFDATFEVTTLLYFAKQSSLYSQELKTNITNKFKFPTVIEAVAPHGVPQNATVVAEIKKFLNTPPPTNGTCDTGYYRSTDECIQCEAGYQCPCDTCRKECPVGEYQDIVGQTECKNCSGTVSADRTQCATTSCVVNQHVLSNVCVACPAGTTNAAGDDASGANTTCATCAAGTFQDGTDSTVCKDCTAGTFQDGTGSTVCKDCTAGTFQDGTGSTVCKDCTAGTFQDGTGSTVCKNCGVGQYQDGVGQTSCKQCQQGYCPEGATEQLSCPVGHMIDTGRTNCTQCTEGKFQSLSNQMSCTNCKSRTRGSTGQLFEYYQDNKGQTKCKRCDGSVIDNSDGVPLAKCAATCTFAANPHICPFTKELRDTGGIPTACTTETCTNLECCQENKVRKAKVATRADNTGKTLLAIFDTVSGADGKDGAAKTAVQNAIQIEKQENETNAQAVVRILEDVSGEIAKKSIEQIDKQVYEMTEEEIVIEKRKSVTEKRDRNKQEAVNLSGLKIKDLWAAVEDVQNTTEKEKGKREVIKVMDGIKETVAEQLKKIIMDNPLADETTLVVIVRTEELKPQNPALQDKMQLI